MPSRDNKTAAPVRLTTRRGAKHSLLGALAGLASMLPRRRHRPTGSDLSRADFKTSTQRLGVRYTEKIRRVFRLRWIKRI